MHWFELSDKQIADFVILFVLMIPTAIVCTGMALAVARSMWREAAEPKKEKTKSVQY